MTRVAPHGSLSNVALEARPTFRYCVQSFTAVATPTDIVVIQGSAVANKRVLVKRVKIDGAATAAGSMPVQLIRRSAAGTLGSAVLTAITAAKHDSGDRAATATVSTVGTANITSLGASAGIIEAGRIQLMAAGSGASTTPFEAGFGDRFDKPVVLRGASEYLCINLSGAAIPAGGVLDITIETEEDDGVAT